MTVMCLAGFQCLFYLVYKGFKPATLETQRNEASGTKVVKGFPFVHGIEFSFQNQNASVLPEDQKNELQKNIFQPMHELCRNSTKNLTKSISDWNKPIIEDIMLIIYLNEPSYSVPKVNNGFGPGQTLEVSKA